MNEKGKSALDIILKMLLITFVSLLAFSSGVYLGKQMSDSDYQLKALESDFAKGKVAKKVEHNDDALVDEEVNTLSEKAVSEEKEKLHDEAPDREVASEHGHGAKDGHAAKDEHGAKEEHAAAHEDHDQHAAAHDESRAPAKHEASAHHEEEKAEEHGHAAAHKPDLSGVHQAAERVANNHAPAPDVKKETSRIPQSLPRTVGPSNEMEFTVQVASYPTMEDAKAHASELIKKGFPAFSVEATIQGKTWYRVSVGSFKTQKDAAQFRAQLIKQADVQTAIVSKIQRQ